MTDLQKANLLFQKGYYNESLKIYNKIIRRNETISHLAQFNIELIYRRNNRPVDNGIRKLYLSDIYNEINLNESNNTTMEYNPLVSVVVTAHNTEQYIEACLESLLFQTYENLEIVVVDDFSKDKTPFIINRLKKVNKNIVYKRLNTNLGTYYAKNYGIKKSNGEIIAFQDSDDISHPKRIELLVSLLSDDKKKIARSAYSRVHPETDEVIYVNGLYKKLGLITLAVRREVFDEIGYFNCTTKASDDEFYNRAVKCFGGKSIISDSRSLYYNTYRDGSLFSDMITVKSTSQIYQKPSLSRSNYVRNFNDIHDNYDREEFQGIFSFPRIRDAINVDSDMTKLPNPRDPVIYNICSIESRVSSLEKSIKSIINQCDKINVYLDGYDYIPKFLLSDNKINIYRSNKHKDLRDGGKFIYLDEQVKLKEDCYYFTIDDDIVYPIDYTNTLINYIDEYQKNCIVGVHGVLLKDVPNGYFTDKRIVYHFKRYVESLKTVNIIGTGTMAFHSSVASEFSLDKLERSGMTDIYFGLFCKQNNIPMIVVPRFDDWLLELNTFPNDSLYNEFRYNDRVQTDVIKSSLPWGLSAIRSCINKIRMSDEQLAKKLESITIQLCSLTR